jgi:hypothetical protein
MEEEDGIALATGQGCALCGRIINLFLKFEIISLLCINCAIAMHGQISVMNYYVFSFDLVGH